MTTSNSTEERFLNLIVIANMRDRFAAMNLRRDRGVEAAISFLGECKLSCEAYSSRPIVNGYASIEDPDELEQVERAEPAIAGAGVTARNQFIDTGNVEQRAARAAAAFLAGAPSLKTAEDNGVALVAALRDEGLGLEVVN